jgi:hypothetical protein
MAIVYRSNKGVNLTGNEVDGNFRELNSRLQSMLQTLNALTTTTTTSTSTTTTTTTSTTTTTTTTTTTIAPLQIKWESGYTGNACSSTTYAYATFNNTFLTATEYIGNFQSIIDSGISTGSSFICLSYNGEFRVNLILQSSTRIVAQESSWGGSC